MTLSRILRYIKNKGEKMKAKRLNLFLLALLLIVPVFLLFGCDEPATYYIELTSSNSNGIASGYGTYTEGDIVTLTARGLTKNNRSYRFVAWVYQNEIILSNDGVYTISTSEDNMTSTLSFTATSATSNNYTAVFEADTQLYYTFSSLSVTAQNEEIEINSNLFNNGSITLSFGENAMSYREVFSFNGQIQNGTLLTPESVNQTMKLSTTSPYQVRLTLNADGINSINKAIPITYPTLSSGITTDTTIEASINSGTITLSFDFEKVSEEENAENDVFTVTINLVPLAINAQ